MVITGEKLSTKMSSSNLKSLLAKVEAVKASIPQNDAMKKEVYTYTWGVNILKKSSDVYTALDPPQGEMAQLHK